MLKLILLSATLVLLLVLENHEVRLLFVGKQLMMQVAELVPRHPGRNKKQEPASSSAAAPSKSGNAAPSSKSGKGGKKRR